MASKFHRRRVMRWRNTRRLTNNQFRRVAGVRKTTLLKLIELLKPKWEARRLAGGAKPMLKLEDQLLLALSYWRNYGTYLETATKFGVSESTAFYICRWIENSLKGEKALHLPGKKTLLEGKQKYEVVVFDVTECPIERPKRKRRGRLRNRQKYYYSGKKKRHTIKQQISVNLKDGKIIATSQSNGKTHDFKIYKKSKNRVHPATKVQGDSGYQGIQKLHPNSELPKKRSKKNPLTKQDKEKNREISSQRVIAENVFAFLKKFKIVSQRYRNRRKRFGLRFNLICGIFNYEWNEKS